MYALTLKFCKNIFDSFLEDVSNVLRQTNIFVLFNHSHCSFESLISEESGMELITICSVFKLLLSLVFLLYLTIYFIQNSNSNVLPPVRKRRTYGDAANFEKQVVL
jgi:hypothetical protein